jgi:hypothetical protein
MDRITLTRKGTRLLPFPSSFRSAITLLSELMPFRKCHAALKGCSQSCGLSDLVDVESGVGGGSSGNPVSAGFGTDVGVESCGALAWSSELSEIKLHPNKSKWRCSQNNGGTYSASLLLSRKMVVMAFTGVSRSELHILRLSYQLWENVCC